MLERKFLFRPALGRRAGKLQVLAKIINRFFVIGEARDKFFVRRNTGLLLHALGDGFFRALGCLDLLDFVFEIEKAQFLNFKTDGS